MIAAADSGAGRPGRAEDGDTPEGAPEKILVIRFGPLGAFVDALGPIAAIRRQHPGARLVLVTGRDCEALARKAAAADEIWTRRPPARFGARFWALVRRLRRGGFTRVYDLEGTAWTAALWRWGGRPDWSGPDTGTDDAGGAGGDPAGPGGGGRHLVDRLRRQLRAAGIAHIAETDLTPLDADIGALGVALPCVLLVPGAPHSDPEGRWPVEKFAVLARRLTWSGVTPVVLGGREDAPLGAAIAARTPESRDLTGQIGLEATVALARAARGAAGNHTGAMHLIAAAGCPSLVLFSDAGDPATVAPRPGAAGGRVVSLRRRSLSSLSVDEVEGQLPFTLRR